MTNFTASPKEQPMQPKHSPEAEMAKRIKLDEKRATDFGLFLDWVEGRAERKTK